MLGLLATAAAAHITPNVIMKAVKSTHLGHKALTGSFSAGVDMGRTGMKLQHNAKHFLEYGAGPESLVEYHLGRKFGGRLKGMSSEEQAVALDEFKGKVREHVGRLSPEQRKELQKTPVLNTISDYAHGKGENLAKRGMMKFAIPEDSKMTVKNHAINAGMLGGAGFADPHLLLQPAISAVRKTVASSKLGKKFMQSNFQKGLDGKIYGKAFRGALDMVVSPSALDPMRLGKTIGNNADRMLKSHDPFQDIGDIFNKIDGLP